MTPPSPIRVGIVDNHPAILSGLEAAVRATDDLVVVGVGRSVDDAISLAGLVDVLVCDVQLDGHAEGMTVLSSVHRLPDPPAVLLVSGFRHRSVVRAAIEGGAAGFLDKSVDVAVIVDAIRTVARGGTAFTAIQLDTMRSAPRRPSERELQVIDLVAGGGTNAEVATRLALSEKTVESHLRRLFDRYGLLSRTELAVLALDEGWITPANDR